MFWRKDCSQAVQAEAWRFTMDSPVWTKVPATEKMPVMPVPRNSGARVGLREMHTRIRASS